MIGLQLACLAIVVVWVVGRARRERVPARLVGRLALLAAAAWIGEDTMIRGYGFYSYSPEWWPFIDRVPLMILMIWPVVIHSAWDLARRLLGDGHRLVPIAGAAVVLADASLIEPIAVQAGLWSWHQPGLFGVPPIGLLGWGLFALLSLLLLERRAPAWQLLVAAPAATHLALIGLWWAALRWVNLAIPPWPVVGGVWIVALLLAVAAWRRQLRRRLPLDELLARVPAASFFFALLALRGRAVAPLVAYAFAFAPPYLALLDLRRAARRTAASPGSR